VCREASYLSETEGNVSGGGIGGERVKKCTLGLGNFTDLDLTLLERSSPNGRRIFEGRYAIGHLWKEKLIRLKNEAMGRKYHIAEEDGMEPARTLNHWLSQWFRVLADLEERRAG